MRERIAVMAGLALFLGWHWVRIEQPMMSWRVMAALSVAAIVPPLLFALHRRVLALLALLVSIWAVLSTATGFQVWERHHPFFLRRVGNEMIEGLRNWGATTTPIDVHRFTAADVDVRVFYAVLLGAVAWSLLVLRRPLLTILLSFVAFAVPATMVSLPAPGVRATFFLLLALLVFMACPRQTGPVRSANALQAVALGAGVLVAAAVLANAPGVTKGEFLNWHNWNPLAADTKPVSVGYVWDQDYRNLKWPRKQTEVFEVTAPRPMYWKATTLNSFADGRWMRQSEVGQYYNGGTDKIDVPPEDLPPRAAGSTASDMVRITFTIKALADPHLLSAEQPVSYELGSTQKAERDHDGTAILATDPGNGDSYTVRAYTPDPTPQQLVDAGASYPQDVRDSIRIGSAIIPAWGSITAPSQPVALSADYLRASDHIWHASGADKANSAYEAVVDVEAYFRSPVFTYDQTPNYKGDLPPLVDFMTRSHRGYCQMFSGSMALVLRLHGIPARVAVGFTEGEPIAAGSSTYKVTDHDAHSWVESYFPGYGWLPFDPTQSRSLQQRASSSTPALGTWARDSVSAAIAGGAAGALAQSNTSENGHLPQEGQNPTGHHGGPVKGGGVSVIAAPQHHRSLLQWMFLAFLAVIAVIVLIKQVALRRRYLHRGPRGLASACFHEVATFAGDQGMDVGPTMSYDDLAARLRKAFGVDAAEFARLGTTARYGPPGKADEAAHGLRGAMRRVKRDLRRELNLGDRAVGAIRLRAALSHEGRLDD